MPVTTRNDCATDSLQRVGSLLGRFRYWTGLCLLFFSEGALGGDTNHLCPSCRHKGGHLPLWSACV
jgi:hypothetical protein